MSDLKQQLEIIKQGIDEIIGEDDLINKLKSPFIMIIKTPIKHEISPIILIELIFSLKKK